MNLSSLKKIFNKLFLILFLVSPFLSYAQQNNAKLRINVIPRTIRQRTEAPVPIFVQSDWQGTAPITGILEMQVLFGNQHVYTTRSQPITFPPGNQSRSMVMPPLARLYRN